MDILSLSGLQYYFLIIYLQFSPVHIYEKGDADTYYFMSNQKIELVFEIMNVYEKDGKKYIDIEAAYKGDITYSQKARHSATIEVVDYQSYKLIDVFDNENEMPVLSDTIQLKRYLFSERDSLIIDSFEALKIAKTKSEAVNYLVPDNLKRSLHNKDTFKNEDLEISVFYNENYNYAGVIIKNEKENTNEEIRLKLK